MKEHPILFSAPMVHALLDGSKTQTRRAVKPQPFDRSYSTHDHRMAYACGRAADGDEIDGFYAYSTSSGGAWQVKCPYGQPGDRLWVRETWSTHAFLDDVAPAMLTTRSLHYWADGNVKTGKRRPSIHMPRWASRILLEIVSVRVERLNDCSVADARAEGIIHRTMNDPRVEYRHLWESINGAGSWDANPWVWVVEFKRGEP